MMSGSDKLLLQKYDHGTEIGTDVHYDVATAGKMMRQADWKEAAWLCLTSNMRDRNRTDVVRINHEFATEEGSDL